MQSSRSNPTPLAHESQSASLFDAAAAMFLLAMSGTILAGAAFPAVLGITLLLTGQGGELISEGGYFFAFVFLGGMVGGMLAWFVSLPVLAFAIAIAWLTGISGREVWLASLIGGWTGFFAMHMVIDVLHVEPVVRGSLIPLAVAAGQCGAGGMILLARRKAGDAQASVNTPMRFGLRQLFGVTTAVAILAAAGRLLRDSHSVFATLGDAAITQAGIIAIAVAVQAIRNRGASNASVPRVTGRAMLADSNRPPYDASEPA